MNTINERGWDLDCINKMIILYYPYKMNGVEKEVIKNIAFEEIREIQISSGKCDKYFAMFVIVIDSGDMYLIDPLYIYKSEEQFKNDLKNLINNITFNDPYNIIKEYLSCNNLLLNEIVKESNLMI